MPDGAGLTVREAGKHTATFSDPDLGRRVLPGDDEYDAGPGHRSYPTPEPPAAAPAPDAPAQLYDHLLVDSGQFGVQYLELLPDCRQRWGVFRTNGTATPSQRWSLLEKHHPDRAAAVQRAREIMQRETRRIRGEPDPDGRA